MIAYQPRQLHQNDREAAAQRLSLSLKEFDRLVHSANHAYEVIKELGPFYGKEENKEPTFRITADPVILPQNSKKLLTQLGGDLLSIGKALPFIPEEYKKMLGDNINFTIPPTWRIDVIIDRNGELKVNEVEGKDGASALMVAEQLAYNLQTLKQSTAAKLIPALKQMCIPQKSGIYKIALVRVDSAHNTNADRFIKFLQLLSKGTVLLDRISENDIVSGNRIVDWKSYAGVIVETSFPYYELFKYGVQKEQLISTGVYNAMVNKGVFALIFDEELKSFWEEKLGVEKHTRLKNILIPSSFVRTRNDLDQARKEGKVVKVTFARKNGLLMDRSQGVAIPLDSVEQGSEDRWTLLKNLLEQKDITLISQDFIMPAKVSAYLRKKSTNLEQVEWYNRVCVKYVVLGDPNGDILPEVSLTATEVTLGPDIVPAGRKCAFTAGKLR